MSENEELDVNIVDDIVSIGKGIVGIAPFFGPIMGEVIGQIIPRQRMDRIAEFIKILDTRLEALELDKETIKEKMKKESYIDLFEDGIWQAARSSSRERKEYIASLLANGIANEDLEEIEENILLSLLSEINDNEIITLYNYTDKVRFGSDPEFRKKHEKVLDKPLVYMGSTDEERDKAAIYESYRLKLVRLGLLSYEFKKPKKDEFPEFDERTGMIKTKGYKLTPLSRLLLKYIDLSDDR